MLRRRLKVAGVYMGVPESISINLSHRLFAEYLKNLDPESEDRQHAEGLCLHVS